MLWWASLDDLRPKSRIECVLFVWKIIWGRPVGLRGALPFTIPSKYIFCGWQSSADSLGILLLVAPWPLTASLVSRLHRNALGVAIQRKENGSLLTASLVKPVLEEEGMDLNTSWWESRTTVKPRLGNWVLYQYSCEKDGANSRRHSKKSNRVPCSFMLLCMVGKEGTPLYG